MPSEFGATPWGKAWVRTVESTALSAPNPALPKARSLARNKAVTLSTATGQIRAEVAGRGATHQVRIDLPAWPERTRAEVDRLLAEAFADNRGLAAGDLPDSLHTDLEHRGISMAVPLDEQAAECDCRARRRPCPDILAALYALAQHIDERPALAVELRSSTAQIPAPEGSDWISLSDIDVASFYGD